jgi:hypothetical protein
MVINLCLWKNVQEYAWMGLCEGLKISNIFAVLTLIAPVETEKVWVHIIEVTQKSQS